MQKLLLIILSAFVLFATSCGSDDDTEPVVEDSGLAIELTSPTDGEVFNTGDVLEVRGTVSDDVEVTDITIAISDILNESPLTITGVGDPSSIPMTDVNVTLNENIVAGTYTLTVKATDNDNNTLSESVDIEIQ